MADAEDRTHAPTPRRLQKAHEQGQVAISRESVLLAGLAAAAGLFVMNGERMVTDLAGSFALMLAGAGRMSPAEATARAVHAWAAAVLPVAAAVVAASAAVTLLQTRFLLATSLLKLDLARLHPGRRLGRILGTQALVETLRALLKLVAVSTAAYYALRAAAPGLPAAIDWGLPLLADHIGAALKRVLFVVLGAEAAIAALDLVHTHWKHWRGLRMSREEVRDEMKETEGDPLIKRRIRQIQQQRARRRMMAAVPKATVVVTNPTHYAVALSYDPNRGRAPRVVAKGTDELARRIREVAQANGVPLVPNPPLARALYKVELDAEIPAEQYRVVAEIIAYVWRLRGRMRAPAGPRGSEAP